MANKIDTQSSSSTPLAGAAVFTGAVSDVTGYTSMTVFCDTDQDGVVKVWHSTDGVNFDFANTITVVAATSNTQIHTIQIVSSYIKVELTNGATIQTHLRLQTILHENYVANATQS